VPKRILERCGRCCGTQTIFALQRLPAITTASSRATATPRGVNGLRFSSGSSIFSKTVAELIPVNRGGLRA